MNLRNKRVFVSGGAGVIGTALIKRLQKEGAIIFVGDLKPRPRNWSADIQYWRGDLNYISSAELMNFNPEVFFHLAATFERSTEVYDFWHENFHHNINLSNHLMTLMKDSNALKKVVFASSYLIYNPEQYNFKEPAQKAARLKETDPIYPRNLCGVAKLLHEMELGFLAHFNKNQYNTVSARIFRVYGKNSRDIVSRWVRSLLKGETITVYKPEGIFDYIYADEVAEGLLNLAIHDVTGIVNLGRDNARKVSELLEVLKQHFPDMKINYSDLDILYEASQANMELYRSKTGWAPSRNLEDTIPEIIEFEKKATNITYAKPVDINILVTSISQKAPLLNAVKIASKKIGNLGIVIGGDINPDCICRYIVDQFYHMPPLDDLEINSFIDYCKDNNVKALIPTRDGELTYFAKNKDLLSKNGISVIISDLETVETCIDKLIFYTKLELMDFPVIQTSSILNDIKSELIVVKERFGAGSKKIGIGVSRTAAQQLQVELKEPIFQPFIEGKEYSVDVYIDKSGKSKGAVVRSRDLIVDGEAQISTTHRNQVLEKLCSEISEKLGLFGPVVWQLLIDERNDVHIIECNTRFGGASTLSIAAGLDSFYWSLLESVGENLNGYPFIMSTKEIKQVRFKTDMLL